MQDTLHTEKFELRNRWTNAIQFTAEITCAPDASVSVKLGLAVKWAVNARANLAGAYLADANFADANFADANLAGANFAEEVLRPFKADLFLTLSSLHAGALDAQHLVAKLRAGEVDGSTYGARNGCACLVGTIAAGRGADVDYYDRNGGRPAERWFMSINPGDKPGAVREDGKRPAAALQRARPWSGRSTGARRMASTRTARLSRRRPEPCSWTACSQTRTRVGAPDRSTSITRRSAE